MKNKIFFLLTILLINFGCYQNLDSNLSFNSFENNYNNYEDITINLNEMYNMKESKYGVYFFSEYCPACSYLKDLLFDYLDDPNKDIKLYLINIGITNENDFNKLLNTNGLSEEEIINNTIGATKIEETYFRTSPCIYIIENNNNKNMIKDYYLNFNKVEDFLKNNI